MTDRIIIKTNKKYELVDITDKIEEIVKDSQVSEGICIVHLPHATAGLISNENEAGLKEDILATLRRLIPDQADYKHNRIDDNAQAHILSSLIGQTKIFIIDSGNLLLGTWQRILFVEFDGPRQERRIIVKIIGEK